MDLGTHYLALDVKDIQRSFDFYINLGFSPVEHAGSVGEKWLVLQNGSTKIALFENMLSANMLTFNPTDARIILETLKQKDVSIDSTSPSVYSESGACHFIVSDPDGNQILFDQHQ